MCVRVCVRVCVYVCVCVGVCECCEEVCGLMVDGVGGGDGVCGNSVSNDSMSKSIPHN